MTTTPAGPRPLRRGLVLLALAGLAGLHGACAGGAPEAAAPEAGESAAEEPAVQVYEVRGEVTKLPAALTNALSVRHESIPGFVDFEGEVVGMDSMTMPFPVTEGVDLSGIEAGDKVWFTLEVEWEGDPPYRIVRVEELPADTVLDFGSGG